MDPFFVAFYSFKGGVGRTMAMANVGWLLAARGKRVVLVDMDLEAPGLPSLVELAPPDLDERPGLVEYATAFASTGQIPPIDKHLWRVETDRLPGGLWVMPAGRMDCAYPELAAGLQWGRLHPQLGSEPLITGLRAALTAHCSPHYVLVDSRTGFSEVGGFSTHKLADLVVLVFNLTKGCLEGTVRAYRSMTESEQHPAVLLLASPVPPVAAGADTLVERRIEAAARLMPSGVPYGQQVLRVDYDPALALLDGLAAAGRGHHRASVMSYDLVRAMIQRANPEEAFQVVEEARRLVGQGRFQDALDELRSFAAAHPGNVDAHLEQGRLLLGLGQLTEARQAFSSALGLGPTLPEVQRGMGECLLALEDFKGALDALRKAEELGDGGVALYRAMARAHERLGESAAAIAANRRALLAGLRSADPAPQEQTPTVRAEFVSHMARNPPYPDFDATRYWDAVMGSFLLSQAQKRHRIRGLVEGALEPEQVREIERTLADERKRWLRSLGPDVSELEARVSEQGVGGQGLLALRRGDRFDALLLLFAAVSPEGAPDLQLLREAAGQDARYPFIHLLLADVLSEPGRSAEEVGEACSQYARAVELAPRDEAVKSTALYNWGNALVGGAHLAQGEERAGLLAQAGERFAEAARAKPDMHEALYNWGTALLEQARMAEGEGRAELLVQARERFAEAVRVKPDKHEALYNWGIASIEQAGMAQGEERAGLLEQACGRFAEAVRVQPDMHEALCNWGITLSVQADMAQGEGRAGLLAQACERFAEAVRVKPDMHEALQNWGNALLDQADMAQGEERAGLLEQACRLFSEAGRVKPDDAQILDWWANALLHRVAAATDPDQARTLALEAAAKARAASELKEHAGDYNLACALSRLGEFDGAWQALLSAVEDQPDKIEMALYDPDLASLWEDRPDHLAALSARLPDGSPK